MYRFVIFILTFLCINCSTDKLDLQNNLAGILDNEEPVLDNVIACAASNLNDDLISVFFYPRPNTSNFKYYETVDATVDKNDFENYIPVELPIRNVFNGFMKKFEVSSDIDKWVIVAFEEGGKTHLSNPIRLKKTSKPTEYISQNVTVNTSTNMPIFTWEDGVYDDTKIYFHVVSDTIDNLLSGTYTFDRIFQYYNLDNVVLNVTPEPPPNLLSGSTYNFTLLGVSEDNWVNLFSVKAFQVD